MIQKRLLNGKEVNVGDQFYVVSYSTKTKESELLESVFDNDDLYVSKYWNIRVYGDYVLEQIPNSYKICTPSFLTKRELYEYCKSKNIYNKELYIEFEQSDNTI